MIAVVQITVLVFLGFWVLAYFMQDGLLFPRQYAALPTKDIPYRLTAELKRTVDGNDYIAWFVPAPGCTADNPCPLVVFCHGNAEIIDHQDWIVDNYKRLSVSILLVEYRGYGRNDGHPSQKGIHDDHIHFYDKVVDLPQVDRQRVFFHGRSLGGAVAAELATERPPKVLIMQSTFSSAVSMANRRFLPGFLLKHPFRTDRVIAKADWPLLLIHGEGDDIIPVDEARALRDVAERNSRDLTYVEMPGAHNDFPPVSHDGEYWQTVETFLREKGILTR
jgi:hypothetical protein